VTEVILPTAEGDLPDGFLNQLSASCCEVPSLTLAYVGWVRPAKDKGAVRLELRLYGVEEAPAKPFRWFRLTGNMVFRDGMTWALAPTPVIVCCPVPSPEEEIAERWLRLY
jgi:hypothetical protein